jgi:hypothetical protein
VVRADCGRTNSFIAASVFSRARRTLSTGTAQSLALLQAALSSPLASVVVERLESVVDHPNEALAEETGAQHGSQVRSMPRSCQRFVRSRWRLELLFSWS